MVNTHPIPPLLLGVLSCPVVRAKSGKGWATERLASIAKQTSRQDKQSSCQQLLVKAKLPSLYNRRRQGICILMYKVKHNLCPRTICDMFLTDSHAYNLRHKDFYQPSFNRVTHGKHSIRYLGPRLWSKIPSKDRSAASLK